MLDALYQTWHLLLAIVFFIAAPISMWQKSQKDPEFLRSRYWLWVAGSATWLGIVWLIQDSRFEWQQVKIVVPIGFFAGVVLGGLIALIHRVWFRAA